MRSTAVQIVPEANGAVSRRALGPCLVALLALLGTFSPLFAANDSAESLHGTVLVGVDPLGRVLVALDKVPMDGKADHCFLFTGTERIEFGAWSERGMASLVHKPDSLTISIPSEQLHVRLSMVSSEQAPHVPGGFEELVFDEGVELARLNASVMGGALLDEMDVEILETWPEAFWYDLLDPASGPCAPDNDCQAGGQGSSACSISGCGIINTQGCSTTCEEGSYACCLCMNMQANPARCRCRPCVPGA